MSAIPISRNAWRAAADLMLVAVLFALLSWAGIVATREAGRVATIWLANGLLIGILLRTSPRRWPAFVGAGLIGNILADLLAGDGIVGAIGLSACNAFEIGLAASWLRRVIGAQPDAFRIAATAWRIVPCVLLAPVVPSALGALTVAIVSGTSFWTALRLWYAADLLGLLLVAPFVLAIDHRLADRLWKSPRRAKNQLALLLLAVVTAVVFAQNELPLLFLVLPPLLLVVFRMGLPGAALGLLVLGVISLGFTVQGTGPLALVESATMPERVLLLQFYLVVASLMAYPVGVALTERHRLQRHLADSERRYRTLSENSSDIIVRTSFDRRRLYMSPSVTDILGWPVDELLGAPRTDLIHPDDLEAYMACDAAIRSGQRTATLVYRYRHREGHYVWLESRSRIAAATGEGEPYEVITTIRDISRRKAVEEDLAKSERDLRAVADHLPALISFADAEGVLQFCNATHAEWLGRDSAELLGHHLSEVLGSQAYDRQHQYLARALTGEAVEFELTLMHCDHPRDTRVSYVPRYSSAGVITGIYALITDITAAKAVERELDRLARFDALTSLPNRYQFDERLSEALARARRSKKPIALLFVDLDHFKTVNDTYGHPVGDEVLQEVARRLRSSLRATDVVARLAGDEFVVILESADAEQEPQFVARKILRAFEKPIDTAAGSIRVTMSIGLTQLRGDEASADALREADVALYRAKAAGRNGFRASS